MLPGWRGRDQRPRHQPETRRPAGENVSITMAPAPNVAQEYHCPDWAFDRSNPDRRPRTGGKWQPTWDPMPNAGPADEFERFVDQILGTLGIKRVYEPLMVPIRYNRQPTVEKRRRRRWVRNDFYLPDLGFFIEVYSGHCASTLEYKQSRLRKLYRLHRIPYLLLTPVEWEILKINPLILRE